MAFYQTRPDGSTGAPHGHRDDRVMARAVAWQMRKCLPVRGSAMLEALGEGPGVFAPRRW